MKFSVAAAAALLGFASAQKAVVVNSCAATVYVQSYPYDGSAPGPLVTVKAGKSFSEDLRAAGSTVKVSKTKTFDTPLFFGYSSSGTPDYSYYELSTEFGNPFAADRNVLTPGPGCQNFNCAPNSPSCYSTPAMKKVYGCPAPVDLTLTICKK